MRGVVKQSLAVAGPQTHSEDFMRLRWVMCIRSPAYSEDGTEGKHFRRVLRIRSFHCHHINSPETRRWRGRVGWHRSRAPAVAVVVGGGLAAAMLRRGYFSRRLWNREIVFLSASPARLGLGAPGLCFDQTRFSMRAGARTFGKSLSDLWPWARCWLQFTAMMTSQSVLYLWRSY